MFHLAPTEPGSRKGGLFRYEDKKKIKSITAIIAIIRIILLNEP